MIMVSGEDAAFLEAELALEQSANEASIDNEAPRQSIPRVPVVFLVTLLLGGLAVMKHSGLEAVQGSLEGINQKAEQFSEAANVLQSGYGGGWRHGSAGYWKWTTQTGGWQFVPPQPQAGTVLDDHYVRPDQNAGSAEAAPAKPAYSHTAAKAFAALAKLAYCGLSEGLSASMGRCGRVDADFPDALPWCQAAGITIDPISFHRVGVADRGVEDALFAYFAAMTMQSSEYKQPIPGCLVVIRGSVNNWANTKTMMDRTMIDASEADLDCRGCSVHRGFALAYKQMRASLIHNLELTGCSPGTGRKLWVTGHGFGAAIAAFALYDLHTLYDVQPSYLFAAPQIGDVVFSAKFSFLFDADSPLFFVSQGMDMVAVWPDGETSHPFERLPFEVHYPNDDDSVIELCLPESMRECGVSQYKRESLLPDNFCTINLAPNGSFCWFQSPEGSCSFGEAFSKRTNYPEVPKQLGLPFDVDSLMGEGVGSKYNENVAKAMAAINKQIFCGASPNLPVLMGQLCGLVCRTAGFELVPGSARMVSVKDQGYGDALFAMIFRFQHVPGDISHFPDDGCVVAFRGAFVNDDKRSSDLHSARTDMTTIIGIGCTSEGKCAGHTGFYNTWVQLQEPVFQALRGAGCPETSNVVVTGYSLGGAVVPFAMYYLHTAGWKVKSSYTISQPRVSNPAFADNFMDVMGEVNATLFRITFGRDAVSRWPTTADGYKHVGYEVHYIEGTTSYEMCGYAVGEESKCGTDTYARAALSYDKYHCPNPLAPDGSMCPADEEFYHACWGVVGV